jgi:hypothetical protein
VPASDAQQRRVGLSHGVRDGPAEDPAAGGKDPRRHRQRAVLRAVHHSGHPVGRQRRYVLLRRRRVRAALGRSCERFVRFVVSLVLNFAFGLALLAFRVFLDSCRLFNTTLTGPGRIWIQSMSIDKLRRLFPPQTSSSSNGSSGDSGGNGGGN